MAEAEAAPCTLYFSKVNLTVLGVLVVFGLLYYVSVFCVIVPWLSYSVPGITNMGVLTVTTCLSLYCYMFCVLLDAGRPPADYQPDQESSSVLEVKRKDGAPRYCQKCQQFKPPRSHHCRKCQRCVLRMDHHCPWTNNCIGHANYRAFFLFLIYVNAALLHVVLLLGAHTLHVLQTSHQQRVLRTGPQGKPVQLAAGWIGSVWLWAVLQVVAFAVALPLTIGLLLLFAWHVQLISVNKTTIEYQEGVTASINAVASGAPLPDLQHHPYDLGLYANLMTIFGANPAAWALPPCAPTAGGTSYPTKWDLLSAEDAEEHEARLLGLTS
ncbi:hypothetical protein PLESTB_000977000 [Pleodorina starrii]|uniref:S-acyltransferase n=1 Tax=Pleodorina starrii TaxID=330485 RepID=A0A9W6F4C4_9CHLO|nr:hypothetical protein PLESTM_001865500 [Pleodorina starrii]GLC55365.1 hypothetical protein PLESTB_000977000 [Pleodorina starrii]GLC66232.1 hypothetical protein PLESTF_000401800 [Pleodorina starrii]